MDDVAKDLAESAIKIAGKALDARARGDTVGAKFLADNAALALALSKQLRGRAKAGPIEVSDRLQRELEAMADERDETT